MRTPSCCSNPHNRDFFFHLVLLPIIVFSSQGPVIHPNPKTINQCFLNIKHEFTYVQGKTYTLLDNHAQAWLHLILCITLPIFSKLITKKENTHTHTHTNNNDHFVSTIQLLDDLKEGGIGDQMENLTNRMVGDIHGLKVVYDNIEVVFR